MVALDDYYVVPKEIVAVSKILSDMWDKLGRPNTPLSPQGEKLMNILIASWEDLLPEEAVDWKEKRTQYQVFEKTIHQQVKGRTGRSLASYPMYIYKIMKHLFPEFDATKRQNCFKMIKKWPIFRMANKA